MESMGLLCWNWNFPRVATLLRSFWCFVLQDITKWPIGEALPSYGRGRELPGPRHLSLIHGVDLTDVVITGE